MARVVNIPCSDYLLEVSIWNDLPVKSILFPSEEGPVPEGFLGAAAPALCPL